MGTDCFAQTCDAADMTGKYAGSYRIPCRVAEWTKSYHDFHEKTTAAFMLIIKKRKYT